MKTFKDEFSVYIGDNYYSITAQGHSYKEDGNIYYRVEEYIIFDEDDELFEDEFHHDHEELMDEIYGRDYSHVAETDDDFSDLY